jgi:3-oxoadipate enol-lactonase
MTREAARWVIGPRSFRRLWPAIGWMGPLALSRPTHAFVAQVAAILDVDDSHVDELGTIELPTLVLVGNQDILTPRGDSEELAERIPTAELVVISGAAHGFMVEHGSTFNRVLLDFLGRAERAFGEMPAAAGATASAAG